MVQPLFIFRLIKNIMPIVQAYECPRTHKLFKDKTKYITHLKTLALKTWQDSDDHPRDKIIERHFDYLRRNATSFRDIATWLEVHGRLLRQMSIRYSDTSHRPLKEKQGATDVMFDVTEFKSHISNSVAKPVHGICSYGQPPGTATSYPGVEGMMRYNETSGLNLHDALPGVLPIRFRGGGKRNFWTAYDFVLFAEDWPFIGAHFLYQSLNAQLNENQKRILRYAFPGIPEDQYIQFQTAGLLPEDPEEFLTYMMQFVDQVSASVPGPQVTVPNDLMTEPV